MLLVLDGDPVVMGQKVEDDLLGFRHCDAGFRHGAFGAAVDDVSVLQSHFRRSQRQAGGDAIAHAREFAVADLQKVLTADGDLVELPLLQLEDLEQRRVADEDVNVHRMDDKIGEDGDIDLDLGDDFVLLVGKLDDDFRRSGVDSVEEDHVTLLAHRLECFDLAGNLKITKN